MSYGTLKEHILELLRKISIVFADVFAVIMLATYIITSSVSEADFIESVIDGADKYDLGVFSAQISIIDNYSYCLDFYGNKMAAENINKYFQIEEGVYNSLVSGKTEVIFHDFSELSEYENRYVSSISFIGSDKNIDKLYNDISVKYEIAYPDLVGGSDKDVVYLVWVIISVILFTLTIFEVIYRKKEITLRVSFGENVGSIICRSIMTEILTDCTIYLLVHKIVFSIISGEFMAGDTFLILGIGVVASSLLYFDYAVYDMKKVLSNVKQSEFFLGINYISKIIITGLTIFSISTSIEMLSSNYVAADENSIISMYPDYSFIKVRNLISVSEETLNERDSQFFEIYNRIFVDYYDKAKPIICNVMLEDDLRNLEYIVVNENAKEIVEGFISDVDIELNTDADVVYLVPDFLEEGFDLSDAEGCLYSLVGNPEELSSEVVYYPAGGSFTCIQRDATYGLNTVDNPVVVWLKNESKCEEDRFLDFSLINDTIFNLTEEDVRNIISEYQIEENGFELSTTSILKSYEIKSSIFKRTVQFCSSLSVFLIILQVILLISVNTLEYQLNAVLLALQKVFGYGTLKKNRRQILLGPGMDILIGGMLHLICEAFKLLRTNFCFRIGFGFAIIELIIILINIAVSEKRSTVKTLKGGCL